MHFDAFEAPQYTILFVLEANIMYSFGLVDMKYANMLGSTQHILCEMQLSIGKKAVVSEEENGPFLRLSRDAGGRDCGWRLLEADDCFEPVVVYQERVAPRNGIVSLVGFSWWWS